MNDHLFILSQTIADHARKLAYEEWEKEYGEFWEELIEDAGLDMSSATLEVDGRTIPIESITKALREEFLKFRTDELVHQLTRSVVETAFQSVVDEEKESE